ncbi:patatin-like phospholipase domain-containing protein [Purpureocillium lilacinum]|uniref:Patatin-like phospholipase domain-containing protein n=1 Tax=Purpureocillium lilacinum TaxID=33203 RepID=A0A179H2C3_PURLI|nr:patatin-like phospholipase domain-containing protein [Purpureocillium lilacinum]
MPRRLFDPKNGIYVDNDEDLDRPCSYCKEQPAALNTAELHWCKGCKKTICKRHWFNEIPHELGSAEHVRLRPADIRELISAAWAASEVKKRDAPGEQDWLSDATGTNELWTLQGREASLWFGIDTASRKSFVNQELPIDLLRGSSETRFGNQFPCIVSFLGSTGAGISSLIKGLNTLDSPSESDMENPVAAHSGRVKLANSGVHLFADISTALSDRPLLYADCEGLFGENPTASGELDEFVAESIDSLRQIGKWITRPFSCNHRFLEREDFVQDEYPRILYPFSDILCYVVQQWPSNQKTLVTDLILWASRAHDKALNQAILPSCIIVVNDTTMKGRHHDHEITTGAILGGIENYPIQGEEIETLANEWNEIARTRSSRITTLGQLFHRYFRDVQILYIPPRSGGSANIVRTQLHKLRDKLQTTSAAIQRQREDTGGRVNTRQLDVYLSRAFESLWSGSGWPFDFGKYATIQEEAPTDLCQHASNLMSQLREQVMDISPDQFESCVANLLSSCAMFHLIRRFPELSEDGGRFSPRGGTIFIRHAKRILKRDVDEFGAAYRRFHQDSRCWYRRGTKQCRNRAKGHSKDHQEYHGSVFAFGGYHTYWTERGNKRFVKRMRATIALGFGVIRGLSEEEFLEAMEGVAKGGLKMQAIGSLERWFPYYEGFFCAKSLDESLTSVLGSWNPLIGAITYPIEKMGTWTRTNSMGKGEKVRDLRVGAVAATEEGESYQTWVLGNYPRDDKGTPFPWKPRAYRHAESMPFFSLWQAARCSSVAPGLFPAARAANHESFVDGNAAKVSTIETAMEEAALIWPSTPEAHIGVSIGVGRSQNRTTPWWFSRVALHSWEDRDVDQYEEDLDPHEAWDKHYRTLSRSQRSRLRRLDVDFQQEALPSVQASRIGN